MENDNNAKDLISIIIPVYRVEEYLTKCIDSVIKQKYTNIEIILVDDGSPDNCPKICDEYAKKDSRIKVIHKENGGLSDARNVGINNASGQYISFIDSDDYIDNDYILFLYKCIKENDSDISICTHYIEKGNRTINLQNNIKRTYNNVEALHDMLYSQNIDVSAWGKLYKKELFKNIKFPIGRLYEDSATTYKLLDISNKIVFWGKSKYHYVIRNNSITTNSFSNKKLDLIYSTKEMTDYISNKYPVLVDACNRRLIYSYLSTLTQMTYTKDVDKDLKKTIIQFIKNNGNSIINDKDVPKRDKIAIITLKLGFFVYKICWKLYAKIIN